MNNQERFGTYIRSLREKEGMPLRKLAAKLDIDQSTLSKIETNQRSATRPMIPIIAEAFNIDIKEVEIKFLSHRILDELMNEKYGLEALKSAQKLLNQLIVEK